MSSVHLPVRFLISLAALLGAHIAAASRMPDDAPRHLPAHVSGQHPEGPKQAEAKNPAAAIPDATHKPALTTNSVRSPASASATSPRPACYRW